jgi:hypothetical protein
MPESDSSSTAFFRKSMGVLKAAEVPFLVGGAYAFCVYTGIARHTKDFDLFVRPTDIERALGCLQDAGYRTEKTFPHWLGKAFGDDETIDLIFRAGNGLCPVDDLWFERGPHRQVFDLQVDLCPVEEMIWMKSFIMERERFDGADVAHLLLHCGSGVDWDHLLARFGPDWRVLLSHLILFGYIYPAEKDGVPAGIIASLTNRLPSEETPADHLCRGTLLSRAQYLADLRGGGFRDARLEPRVGLTQSEIDAWTAAIDEHVKPHAVQPQN